jgi:hypothetical protein
MFSTLLCTLLTPNARILSQLFWRVIASCWQPFLFIPHLQTSCDFGICIWNFSISNYSVPLPPVLQWPCLDLLCHLSLLVVFIVFAFTSNHNTSKISILESHFLITSLIILAHSIYCSIVEKPLTLLGCVASWYKLLLQYIALHFISCCTVLNLYNVSLHWNILF